MIAGMSHHNWHLSWWEWHLLLLFAFLFVAYSAYIQFRREGSSGGLFDAVALSATARRIHAQYEQALEEVVTHVRQGRPLAAARLAGRFRLTEGQTAVLDRAAGALANERELSERLGALAELGRQARVGLSEDDLVSATLERVRETFGDVRLSLLRDGALHGVTEAEFDELARGEVVARDEDALHPLTVKNRLAGVLAIPSGPMPEMAATLANQMSIALENARIYHEVDTLFRQYMSPDVAQSLLADPDQAALGGSLVEVTTLFADLRGFTTFSEKVAPGEIVEMLNRYHTAAVPCILRHGGTIVQFVGDALLALFNAPTRQPDHAARAVRAALEMQEAAARVSAEVAGAEVEWPKFRVGVNTGPALVGNIGSPEFRGFNAMGDAVNVAARLQALADPGTVVIGQATRDLIGPADVVSLGDLALKGKEHTVRAYRLERLR
jgi:class 3 adenylate cyclase